jgi:hypothetical protein
VGKHSTWNNRMKISAIPGKVVRPGIAGGAQTMAIDYPETVKAIYITDPGWHPQGVDLSTRRVLANAPNRPGLPLISLFTERMCQLPS